MGSALIIGVIGVGKISEQYFAAFPRLPGLRLVAVADLDTARASEVAGAQGVEALSVDELLADPRVQAIVNLTIPAAHADIDRRSLEAGKHVYAEKPLALSAAEGAGLIKLAAARGLRLGSAPDTVLGTGVQTARAALDSGMVGEPVAAAASWSSAGHELWHPSPDFYYQSGAGPMFDMGPYYLSALVTLLGPVVSVVGLTSRSQRQRTVSTGPLAGSPVAVDVDTHVTALLEHNSGVTSTVTMSFEVWGSRMSGIEVYGTEGTIAVPDPNRFSDPVDVFTAAAGEWRTIPVAAGYSGAERGYGLADMAHAIATNRPHRASGDLAYHVLEIMDGILQSGRDGHFPIRIVSSVSRPEPVPAGAAPDSW